MGSTLLAIENPDGSRTVVTIGRDGTVARTTTRTDPSTGLETTVVRQPDGTEGRSITGPDTVITIAQDEDGNPVRRETVVERPDEHTIVTRVTTNDQVETTTDTTSPDGTRVTTVERPDGSVETTTARQFTEPDGSIVEETTRSDGSFGRSVSRPDGSTSMSVVEADGTVHVSEHSKLPGGGILVTETVDGEVSLTVEEVPIPGGTRTTVARNGGTPPDVQTSTVHHRTDEQGREVVESRVDGPGLQSRVEVQIGTDGEGFSLATDADGRVVEQRRTTFEPDGTRVDEVLDADGTSFVSRSVPLPGGAHETTLEFADGATVVQFVDPDGHVTTTARSRDGVETVTEVAPDGSGSRVTNQPDGEPEVDTFDADPAPSRGVVFDDDRLVVGAGNGADGPGGVDGGDPRGVDADEVRADGEPQAGDGPPIGFVPRDVIEGGLTNRIRELSDSGEVDHSDVVDRTPPPPAPPERHFDVTIGEARIEEPERHFDVTIGEARIEEPAPAPQFEVTLGEARIEDPASPPAPEEFTGAGVGGEPTPGQSGIVLVPDQIVEAAEDTGRGFRIDPDVLVEARGIVDDLQARAQWLSDERPTPLADVAPELAPPGLDPERLGLLADAADSLIQATNPGGAVLGGGFGKFGEFEGRLIDRAREQDDDPRPFPDDDPEDTIRVQLTDREVDQVIEGVERVVEATTSVAEPILDRAVETASEAAGGMLDIFEQEVRAVQQTAGEALDDAIDTLGDLTDQVPVPPAVAPPTAPLPVDPLPVVDDAIFDPAVRAVEETVTQVVTSVEETVTQAVTGVEETAEQVYTGLEETAEQVVTGVEETAEQVYTGLAETAEQVVTGVEETAQQVYTGLEETAEQVVTGVEETAEEWIADPLGTLGDYVEDAPPVAEIAPPPPVEEAPPPPPPAEPVYEAPPAEEAPVYEPAVTAVEETYDAPVSYVDDTVSDAASAVEDFLTE